MSRYRFLIIPIIVIFLTLSLALPHAAPPVWPQVAVTDVVDGDTFKAVLNSRTESIRLIGVDTPETVHPSKPVQTYGREASTFTKYCLIYRQVYLEFDAQERDKYGRILAYVWLAKPAGTSENEIRQKMFNSILLLEGFGQISTIPPNIRYSDLFAKFQQEAREAGRGLWGLAPVEEQQTTPAEKQAPPAEEDQKEITVYITKTGAKYHRAGCRYLSKSCIPISLKQAKALGYTPCSVCKPPT